jgi:hypothetical protein
LKTVDKIFAWMLVVLGCIRCGMAFMPGHFSSESLSGGTAIIAAGFLNVIRTQSGKGALPRFASIAINLLMTLACLALIWARGTSTLHAPLTILLTIALVAELLFSVQA